MTSIAAHFSVSFCKSILMCLLSTSKVKVRLDHTKVIGEKLNALEKDYVWLIGWFIVWKSNLIKTAFSSDENEMLIMNQNLDPFLQNVHSSKIETLDVWCILRITMFQIYELTYFVAVVVKYNQCTYTNC